MKDGTEEFVSEREPIYCSEHGWEEGIGKRDSTGTIEIDIREVEVAFFWSAKSLQ